MNSMINKTLLEKIFVENKYKRKRALYVHVPFCVQKCSYCICDSKVASDDEIAGYFSNILPDLIEKNSCILQNVIFDEIDIGGGTPTIIPAKYWAEIFKIIPNFDKIKTKCVETTPWSMTHEHLDLFKTHNFNYISIGVQTLSEKLLKKQNRTVVPREKIQSLVTEINDAGIISNIDLLCYLDTGGLSDLAGFKSDLYYMMAKVKPVSITLHSNYKIWDTVEKRKGMITCVKDIIENEFKYYKCTNCLLRTDTQDIFYQMRNHCEYRLMRSNYDFNFRMIYAEPLYPMYDWDCFGIGLETSGRESGHSYYYGDPGQAPNRPVYERFMEVRNALGL